MQVVVLDEYIDAWLLHPNAGSADGSKELQALLGLMASDVTYEDVPTGLVFHGHQGVTDMCAGAHAWSNDLTITVVSRQTDGVSFAFEAVNSGTNTGAMGPGPASGKPFSFRSVSIGKFGADGLVTEQHDYWDLMSFLGQIGMLPS